MKLFSEEKGRILLPNAEIIYIPNFYCQEKAEWYYRHLYKQVSWQQDTIKLFGKTHLQPRLTVLYADNEKSYSYSNITMFPKKFTSELNTIKQDVECAAQHSFTTILLNLYRDGNDSNGWHADNEKELGENPVIASLSLGAVRNFHFKHRKLKDERYKLLLTPGSLLIMKGEMQTYWLHQVPKTKRSIAPRINLTLRTL